MYTVYIQYGEEIKSLGMYVPPSKYLILFLSLIEKNLNWIYNTVIVRAIETLIVYDILCLYCNAKLKLWFYSYNQIVVIINCFPEKASYLILISCSIILWRWIWMLCLRDTICIHTVKHMSLRVIWKFHMTI